MSSVRQYLICTQRTGHPRVALEVCGLCRKERTCQALRDFRQPLLFPGLEARPPALRRSRVPALPKQPGPAPACLPLA